MQNLMLVNSSTFHYSIISTCKWGTATVMHPVSILIRD